MYINSFALNCLHRISISILKKHREQSNQCHEWQTKFLIMKYRQYVYQSILMLSISFYDNPVSGVFTFECISSPKTPNSRLLDWVIMSNPANSVLRYFRLVNPFTLDKRISAASNPSYILHIFSLCPKLSLASFNSLGRTLKRIEFSFKSRKMYR